MQRISVVINKNWEAEPAINAMTSGTIRPAGLPFPTWVNSPKDSASRMNAPRLIYQLNGSTPLQITVWCLQDLMNPAKSSSSSEEKYRVLPGFLNSDRPDMVIAVGTACYPDKEISRNGKVVVGSQFFLSNGHPDNPDSNFKTPEFGKLITSNVCSEFFDLLTQNWLTQSAINFLPVPNLMSGSQILANQNFVSIGTLNVTNYDEYPKADAATLNAFQSLATSLITPSLETTHGIIRLSSNAPAIFVSGIVNRMTKLKEEATNAQNYIGAFNAGVTVANLLQLISQTTLVSFKA